MLLFWNKGKVAWSFVLLWWNSGLPTKTVYWRTIGGLFARLVADCADADVNSEEIENMIEGYHLQMVWGALS